MASVRMSGELRNKIYLNSSSKTSDKIYSATKHKQNKEEYHS